MKAVVCGKAIVTTRRKYLFVVVQVILVEILFARLLSTATTDPHSSSSSRKQTPFVMRGARHRWLDNVVPFGEGGVWGEGEEGNGQETVGRKHDYRLGDLLQLQASNIVAPKKYRNTIFIWCLLDPVVQ